MSELMTPDELAEELGIPRATINQWRYWHKGPAFIKVGKHVRYRRGDVAAWLEAHRTDPREG
jgi:excisionase family DNA binding protein